MTKSDNSDPGAPASRAALAGVIREVDGLRRVLRTLSSLPSRVSQLEATLAQAIEDLGGSRRRPEPVRPLSWIAHSVDPAETADRLSELGEWVAAVYLQYPLAARDLPDCWMWHPDVVEELAWLYQSWQAAYNGETGTVAAAADWHDRYRPGAVARIRVAVRVCSLENHTGTNRKPGVFDIPSVGSIDAIAEWWSAGREHQPPLPTEEDLTAARRRLQERRR
jgi:hypothetical protein